MSHWQSVQSIYLSGGYDSDRTIDFRWVRSVMKSKSEDKSPRVKVSPTMFGRGPTCGARFLGEVKIVKTVFTYKVVISIYRVVSF